MVIFTSLKYCLFRDFLEVGGEENNRVRRGNRRIKQRTRTRMWISRTRIWKRRKRIRRRRMRRNRTTSIEEGNY